MATEGTKFTEKKQQLNANKIFHLFGEAVLSRYCMIFFVFYAPFAAKLLFVGSYISYQKRLAFLKLLSLFLFARLAALREIEVRSCFSTLLRMKQIIN